MNTSKIVAIAIGLILISLGGFFISDSLNHSAPDDNWKGSLEIAVIQENIQQVNETYLVSIRPFGSTGDTTQNLSSVEVIMLDQNCTVMKTVEFTSFDTVAEMNEISPQEVAVDTVPSYVVPRIPQQEQKGSVIYTFKGYKRTGDGNMSDSYEWTQYEISDESNESSRCTQNNGR